MKVDEKHQIWAYFNFFKIILHNIGRYKKQDKMVDNKLTNKILKIIAPGESVDEHKDKIRLISGVDGISDDEIVKIDLRLLLKKINEDTGLNVEEKIKRHKDGRVYLRIGSKIRKEYGIKEEMIIGQNEFKLLDKIMDAFYLKRNIDLTELYRQWIVETSRKRQRKGKTIKENISTWNNYIKDADLAKFKIVEITTHDLNEFLDEVSRKITEKKFNGIKGELKSIFSFGIDQGFINFNPVSAAYTASHFRRNFTVQEPRPIWEEDNIKAVLSFLAKNPHWDDPYYVIIRLSMFLFCRVSELVAIKYEDISDGYLFIRRSICPAPEIVEENGKIRIGKKIMQERNYTKNHRKEGYIKMPLPEEAVQIIDKYHGLHPENVYLFEENGKALNGNKLNTKLKKICEEIHVPYCSIHQVRFGNCAIAYRNGIPIEDISMLMGHARVAQTIEYLRSRNALPKEMEKKIKKVMSHGI